jgi:hypothetical protein
MDMAFSSVSITFFLLALHGINFCVEAGSQWIHRQLKGTKTECAIAM